MSGEYVVIERCPWMPRPTIWGKEDPDSSYGTDGHMDILPFTREEAEAFALTLRDPGDAKEGVVYAVVRLEAE